MGGEKSGEHRGPSRIGLVYTCGVWFKIGVRGRTNVTRCETGWDPGSSNVWIPSHQMGVLIFIPLGDLHPTLVNPSIKIPGVIGLILLPGVPFV